MGVKFESADLRGSEPRKHDAHSFTSVEELAKIARANRLSSDRRQLLSLMFCLVYVAVTPIVIFSLAGLFDPVFLDNGLVEASAPILLFVIPLGGIVFLAILQITHLFRGGWFYDHADPTSARRGMPRDWFTGIARISDLREHEAAAYLAKVLHFSFRAKYISFSFRIICLSVALSAVIGLTGILVAAKLRPDFWRGAETVAESAAFFVQTIGSTIFLLNMNSSYTELPKINAIFLYYSPTILCIFYSLALLNKAVSIRWALLPSCEAIWRYLYYYEMKKNEGRPDYSDDDGQHDAYEALLVRAMPVAPEEFFTIDGRPYFIGDEGVTAFSDFVRQLAADSSSHRAEADNTAKSNPD